MRIPSEFDNRMLHLSRKHINDFITKTANMLSNVGGKLLEIGPQDRDFVQKQFSNFTIDTFDIVDTYNPTHVGDITQHNHSIEDSTYDVIICMEVLEHTVNPFDAIKELRRMLKDGGYLLVSAPLNFRIHGPSPDCWRFTEHGWMVLLKDFDILDIDIMETEDRELFPVKYNILSKCNKEKNTQYKDIKFRFI